MLANMSIKTKILVLSIITIIVVSLSIAVNSIYSINKVSQENIITPLKNKHKLINLHTAPLDV